MKRFARHRGRAPIPAPPQVTPGEAPGLLSPDASANPSTLRAIGYGQETHEDASLDDVRGVEPLLSRHSVTWLDVTGLGSVETLRATGELFGLHRLLLEDVANVGQRPKAEAYDDRLFIVGRMPASATSTSSEQVSIVMGRGFVVTFQERAGDCFEGVRKRIVEGKGRLRSRAADYLVYALLDAIVDAHFPRLETLGEELQALEDEVLSSPGDDALARIQRKRVELVELRRVVWPLREAIGSLMRDDTGLMDDSTGIYLRDCHDHATQALDLIESYREIVSGLMSVYLSVISNRMNEVMKVLTIIATIFIPLGFIAGLYGMNFDGSVSPWNMPELRFAFGYPLALGLMAGVAAAMLIYFRRKRWI